MIDDVRRYLEAFGWADRVQEFDVSSATVELAAKALQCDPRRIAKTLSFKGEPALLVVAAGDARIDNRKFKAVFGMKAKMLSPEEVERFTGHRIGGVCPFALPEGTAVYLDASLQRFETVYPACGSANSAIRLTPKELERASRALGWVDVCKDWV